MRAVRFHGREDIRVDEVEEPLCGHDQVKVWRSGFMIFWRYFRGRASDNKP